MATSLKKKRSDTEKQKLIAEAMKRWYSCYEATDHIREAFKEDVKFVNGDHWPEEVKKSRENDNRPCMVVNKLPQYINHVINDQRQNRPGIRVRPVDGNTDPKTADVINGLIRHISNNSNAKAAFDHACDYAVIGGMGFFRVLTDYADDMSFEQDILIKRIENPLSVYFPVHLCREADYSDAPFCFVVESMPKEEFEAKYPNANAGEWSAADGDIATYWITDDSVMVAEYWVVEEKPATLYQLIDGTTTYDKPEDERTIYRSREGSQRKVKWYLLTASDILDEKEWPSKWIPIIPVLGKELIDDGRKFYISLTRNAKDPQRMYNYWKSCETEMIALAPKAPYVGAKGQFDGFEAVWQTANVKNHAYLEYNSISSNGERVPAPQRTQPAQIPSAVVNAVKEASDDIKATTGIYDSALGAQSNETSGKAILARQKQGDRANFHFMDNLNHAMRHTGRIIIDLIPSIYDTGRTIRIVGEDDAEDVIAINQLYRDPETGEEVEYDLRDAGRYDVVVDTGPSNATKRMEAAEALMELVQSVPKVGEVSADVIVKTLDFHGADEVAERIRKTIPPEILGDEADPDQMGPEEIQQVVGDLQKLMQENEQLKGVLAEKEAELQSNQADNQTKIEQSVIKATADIEREKIKANSDVLQQIIDELNYLRARVDGMGNAAEPFRPVSVPSAEQDNMEVLP